MTERNEDACWEIEVVRKYTVSKMSQKCFASIISSVCQINTSHKQSHLIIINKHQCYMIKTEQSFIQGIHILDVSDVMNHLYGLQVLILFQFSEVLQLIHHFYASLPKHHNHQ